MKRGLLLAGIGAVLFGALAIWIWPLGGRKVIRNWLRDAGGDRFTDPEGLAVDAEGNIYVADEDRGAFTMLDREGRTIFTLETLDGHPGRVTSGDSMVLVGTRHLVAIAEHNLLEFRIEGGKPVHIRTFSKRGHADGEFEDPEGISRDPATGEIYATDEDHNRVMVFDREGRYLRKMDFPHNPESVCFFEGRVYVTFSKDGYCAAYDPKGAKQFEFGRGVTNEPDFATVGPDRQLYITDKRGDKIEVFDLDGKALRTIRAGFSDPEDLAFDPDGNLVVADGGNHRLVVLKRDGTFIREIR